MTAKSYIQSLGDKEIGKVKSLMNSPNFAQFLAGPSEDPVSVARCESAGIPREHFCNADALHYLAVAINNYAHGNA